MKHKAQKDGTSLDDQALDILWKTVDTSVKKDGAEKFLKEILTDSEQLMLGRRLLIAGMLLRGFPQTKIRTLLQVSPNSVWKVRRWLQKDIPEYGTVLKTIEKERSERWKKAHPAYEERSDPFSFYSLRKKYPAHFLLFNLADEIMKRITK